MNRRASIAICLALSACTDDRGSFDTTVPAVASSVDVPIVDQIDDAIAALELELGGPQEYFEINATARLINLFVAVDAGTAVQPWLYFGGELTADDRAPAEGGVLRAGDLDFDPVTIFSRLQSELPGATIESFYIHGDGLGAIQYAALLTTSQGGAIEVELRSDGQIISSEPLN